jgi:hypothetical protein
MKEATLVIMAAGMGSRYGGLKQIDPVTEAGEIIMDFSLYDAMMAGFKKAVFVIREEMEEDFRKLIDERCGRHMQTAYAHQKIDSLPAGYELPEGREKPWGTAHAVLSAKDEVDGPFAVINADDYYGPGGFQLMYDFLMNEEGSESGNGKEHFCMVGYQLKNTITENGHVARGVCEVSEEGLLENITERTKIQRVDGDIAFTEDDGYSWTKLDEDTPVSINFWGFTHAMMEELEAKFPAFLDEALKNDPLKGEYWLPKVADELVREDKADVRVLTSKDRWYGVTYKEDKPDVMNALQSMKDKGLYPEKLWK